MLKQLAASVFLLALSVGSAFGQIDVNQADQAALDGIKGIGPAKSKLILEERKKGQFKDWNDLESRVKGIGGKSAVRLSAAGLTVNGKAREQMAQQPRGSKPAAAKAAAAESKK